MLRVALAFWLALFMLPAHAQSFPELTGRVVDGADLLRPEQELDLERKLATLESESGRQFVVVTVAGLDGRTIEDYGYQLGRHWGIGDEQRDDGVILLVAPNERKVRIENGYGATVFLTDALSSIIIRNQILPRFRAGDMSGGIMAGAEAIISHLQLSPEEAERRAREAGSQQTRQAENVINPIPVIFLVLIFFFVIGSIAKAASGQRYTGKGRRRRGGLDSGDLAILLWGLDALSRSRGGRRGGWGGGGFGGFGGGGGFGGFSGGGGSFGGGGASGGW